MGIVVGFCLLQRGCAKESRDGSGRSTAEEPRCEDLLPHPIGSLPGSYQRPRRGFLCEDLQIETPPIAAVKLYLLWTP